MPTISGNHLVHICDSLQHTLAVIAVPIAILSSTASKAPVDAPETQLRANTAVSQYYFHLYCRVAP